MFDGLPIIEDIPLDIRVSLSQIFVVIAIFAVLWIARRFVAGLLYRPLRNMVESTDKMIDDMIFTAIKSVSSYLALALSFFFAILILNPSGGLRTLFANIALTLVLVAVFRAVYGVATEATQSQDKLKSFTHIELQKPMIPVIRITVKLLLFVLGFLMVMQVWGFSIAGLLAGIGLGGLALSLAAKEVLDDVIGFMTIIGDDIFTLDEYIVSPHGEGIIEKIGLRSTRVRQLDQGLVVVPNSTIANDPVTNWSRLQRRWFNFMVGVTYQATADQIEAFVRNTKNMLRGRENVEDDSILVLFTEYDDSSLNILVRCYVDIEDWSASKEERHAVNLQIMQIVNDLDMSMAYPTRSLYLEDVPPVVADGMQKREQVLLEPDADDDNRSDGRTYGQHEKASQTYKKGGQDSEINSHEDPQDMDDGE